MTRRYLLFGLVIGSDLDLPGLPPAPMDVEAAVSVEFGPVPPWPQEAPGYNVDPAGAHLYVPEVARFRIERGRRIVVAPEPGASERNVRLYVLGSAMGALLHQRGILPLHANAVDLGGGAVAFLGHSGAGKSTLADWFRREGYRILSDDVCALDGAGAVLPGIPRLRLWRDVLTRSDRPVEAYEPSYDGQDKFDVPIEVSSLAPVPLAGIYLLERSPDERFGVERLTGSAAVRALVENTYRGAYLRFAGQDGAHLLRCATVAREVSVFRVERAWSVERLGEQAVLLAAHARKIGAAMAR